MTMSAQDFVVNAQARSEEGKGASRRLRRTNLVPAIIYGGDKEPQSLSLKLNETVKHLENEAFYAHVLVIDVDGDKQEAILRDVQRHPVRQTPMHLDFMRIVKGQEMTKRVPLHYINEESSVGVKTDGGIPNTILSDITISCIPSKLPEYIEVDVAEVAAGQSLHLSDITLPEGVTIPELAQGEDHDLVIFAIEKKKAVQEDSEEGSGSEETPAE